MINQSQTGTIERGKINDQWQPDLVKNLDGSVKDCSPVHTRFQNSQSHFTDGTFLADKDY